MLVLQPQPVADDRGFFVRTLDADVLASAGVDAARFVQENQSRTRKGVVRGLHVRGGRGESKLVRCARGAVFDVLVDVRPASPTFGQWESWVLDDREHRQLHIPPGCAHGFQALTEHADLCYHHDARYVPGDEIAVAWDDPDLSVLWPLPVAALSDRDRRAPRLGALRGDLERWFGQRERDPTP